MFSGEADKDKIMLEVKPVEGVKAFFCIKCGVSLDVSTTRGVYEVVCKYCETINKIK